MWAKIHFQRSLVSSALVAQRRCGWQSPTTSLSSSLSSLSSLSPLLFSPKAVSCGRTYSTSTNWIQSLRSAVETASDEPTAVNTLVVDTAVSERVLWIGSVAALPLPWTGNECSFPSYWYLGVSGPLQHLAGRLPAPGDIVYRRHALVRQRQVRVRILETFAAPSPPSSSSSSWLGCVCNGRRRSESSGEGKETGVSAAAGASLVRPCNGVGTPENIPRIRRLLPPNYIDDWLTKSPPLRALLRPSPGLTFREHALLYQSISALSGVRSVLRAWSAGELCRPGGHPEERGSDAPTPVETALGPTV